MGSWYGMNGLVYVCLKIFIRDICRQEIVWDTLTEMRIWVNLKKTKRTLKLIMCLITHHTLKMCVCGGGGTSIAVFGLHFGTVYMCVVSFRSGSFTAGKETRVRLG
jgi:hypothetical protein